MEGPRLIETDRGLSVYSAGRHLYSNRNPSGRPEKIAAAVPERERCLYFVPSPLLGYGLQTLANRIPESSAILAVESSQELMAICSPSVAENLRQHPSITWVRLSDRPSLHELLCRMGPWRFREVRRVDLSAGAGLFPETYDDLADFLSRDLATYWKNRHALGRLGRDWIRHSLANLRSIADYPERFSSAVSRDKRITVVIGAGPSLEEGLGFLGKHRGALMILAADTAVPALMESGIRPDGIIALETQAWNMLDFHGLAGSGIPVFADLTSYPPGLSITGGPVRLFSSRFADLDYINRLDRAQLRPRPIPPLGSVGLAALEIALTEYAGPVLLCGLDFAYSPGKSHSRGTSIHRWQLANSRRTDPMPLWEAAMRRPRMEAAAASGGKTTTDAVLASYAATLADRYGSTGRVFILAPGGLDLGLPVLESGNALAMLEKVREELPPDKGTGPSGSSPRTGDAASFLEKERLRFEKVIEAWDAYAAGSDGSDAVVESLRGLDELFCDFPDEPPLPKADDSFLVRAVMRSRRLLRVIERQAGS